MEKKNKKSGSRTFIILVFIIALLAVAAYFIFFFHPQEKKSDTDQKKAVETQAATEFDVTPADDEDVRLVSDALNGVWASYTDKGVPFTYSFSEDGSVRYKKDGENAVDYTYTFEDGFLTIKNDKKSFVYQCSKDAVGMMARMQYGEWKSAFSEMGEKITDFNGCVYIVDDLMYLGSICLCRDDSIKNFKVTSLEGDWLGAVGDTINFASDGSYTYVQNAEEYHGTYQVDPDKKLLNIVINNHSTDYDEEKWGLDGRVFHIDDQYYFKVSE